MLHVGGRQFVSVFYAIMVVTASGCADMDIFPSWMPFQGPPADTLPGVVTPAERIAKLQALSENAAAKSEEEKQQISRHLAETIRQEKDPLIRMEIIRVLGKYPSPTADAILKAAINDADSQVRVAACEAWGKRNDPQAVRLLAEAMRSDVDSDVRLAAAKALGETQSPEAVTVLGEALDDTDPAMQYRAVLSLKQVTGKDFGNNVNRWQQYVKGDTSVQPPSLAEQIRAWF